MNELRNCTPQRPKATQIPTIYVISFRVLIDIWNRLFICFLSVYFLPVSPIRIQVPWREGSLLVLFIAESQLLRTVFCILYILRRYFWSDTTTRSWHVQWELFQTIHDCSPLHIKTHYYSILSIYTTLHTPYTIFYVTPILYTIMYILYTLCELGISGEPQF